MRIIQYNVKLDDDRKVSLVKEKAENYVASNLTSPEGVVSMMNAIFDANNLAEEYVWIIGVNTKGRPIGVFEVSHGTVNMSMLNPREVFIRLLLCGAASFMIVHNHPSGDPTPSSEDIKATKRLIQAGVLVGIELRDHIIIGERYYSFYANEVL